MASFLLSGARMDQDALRGRIRQLIAFGDLPPAPPLSDGTLSGHAPKMKIRRIVIGRSSPDPCFICGETGPTMSFIYTNQRVIRVHGTCEALWREEGHAET